MNKADSFVDVNCVIDIPEDPSGNEDRRYDTFIKELTATVIGILQTAHKDSPEEIGLTVERMLDELSTQLVNMYGESDGLTS
jgi:hypothetical protein